MAEETDITAKTLTPDICVIGAGSAGLSVAAGAAAFGVPVVLIERDRMGGDCLNHGCVPSKALIAAAKHAHAVRQAAAFGVGAGEPVIDFEKVQAHVQGVIAAIAPNDSVERFTALGVQVIKGEARFVDGDTVAVGDVTIRARRFVIATGSSTILPPIPGLAEIDYLTNESLFDLKQLPEHLLIIGGGPVGLEMAQAHRRLGAAVTVIDVRDALAGDDPELVRIVIDKLRDEGITLFENTHVLAAGQTAHGIWLQCENGEGAHMVEGSAVLLAAGRRGNTVGLELQAAGIRETARGLAVDTRMRTDNRRVYAIGDVAGGPQFTHMANYHASLVLREILFRLPVHENRDILPRTLFTEPEMASVGLTEEEARRRYDHVKVLRWPYSENDRAQAERATSGLIKIVVGRRGRILGVGIVGAGAAEMINMWSMVIANGQRLRHIRNVIAPYPTMSEIGKRAVIAYYTPMTRKPFVRAIIRFLRRFG
ncbi:MULTISPECIES: dihydrolipoyl dehydrogenase family protein [unclassified Rhizobium]|uniref:dihydrolipoyl dehydrogenase family protein n=1 Tax=unclassified Rhizobium TaxID=2613769 RepID=UPI000712DC8A|nr:MULTISPECIES: FAD-dependent oxidoreductase [unclassified Rhizobium]KQS90396.1 dihydrolipoamide dehydrogenase [Rhizobium sp. Leaf386]KQS90699.1 dihydrolipoamide dehydrogenase [Rhizobium sp. Leaf391]KQU10137.1 dihydrolipoamide dehydrogenase [Rhizobium sp. Leaf453]